VSDHKWLTLDGISRIERFLSTGDPDYAVDDYEASLIADWQEMRRLLVRLDGVRSCDELPEAAEVWSDVVDMMEATSDD